MRAILPIVLRVSIAAALGWAIGMAFGDRYGSGERYFEFDPAVQQASAITGAVLGLILGVLSATPWIGARSHGVAFFRGVVAGVAALWLVNRMAGGFTYEFTPALVAFGLVGGLLGAIGSRRVHAPAARRWAARENMATVGMRALKGAGLGIVAGLLLAFLVVGTEPKDLGVLVYAYAPAMLAIVGIVIGVLVPSTRVPISRRRTKTRSRQIAS